MILSLIWPLVYDLLASTSFMYIFDPVALNSKQLESQKKEKSSRVFETKFTKKFYLVGDTLLDKQPGHRHNGWKKHCSLFRSRSSMLFNLLYLTFLTSFWIRAPLMSLL